MKLRLSHKGLMLVSGVLLFELVLVAIFAGLLGRSDQELDKSYLAVSVINHVDKLRKALTDVELAAASPVDAAQIPQLTDPIHYELKALRLFLREDSASTDDLYSLEQLIDREQIRFRDLNKKAPAEAGEALADLKNIETKISAQLDFIAKRYRRPLEFVTDQDTLSRRLTETNIVFVVLLNAVVAVATTLFFVNGIVSRLSVVADNSRRFGRGGELNPPLEGTDEIAILDRVLHETIRQRTNVENLLKENEARTRSLIENMPVGVVAVSEDGLIESINPQMEKMFGYSYDELVGDHLVALFNSSETVDRDEFTRTLHAKARGKSVQYEARRKNGEFFPFEITLSEYDSVDGKRFLAIIQDITERHQAEQFKQELIAMVSHDLRSPLTSVQGVMTLLARGMYGQLSETGEKRVKVAEHSLSRLIHLVDDILDLQRMEAGKLQFNRQTVAVSSIIDRSIEAVYDFAQQCQIKFETPESYLDLYADEDRIVQVVVNLLSNAIKFSPRGSTIKLAVREVADSLEVSVQDEGPGVPLEHQEGIFLRFHQLDSQTSSYKGTGLGLAICKAIVEGHDGTIGVVSEEPHGSRFWFRIPNQERAELQLVAAQEGKPSGVLSQP